MKSLINFFLFILILWGANTVSAQEALKGEQAKKAEEVKALINSGRYTFKAIKIISPKNNDTTLPRGYVFDVSKDTLIVCLPSDKMEITAVNPREAGITWTRFDYNKESVKNGSWSIFIKPRRSKPEMHNIRNINLDISRLGYATLTVKRNYDGPVSYYGYITQHIAEFPQHITGTGH